MWRVTITSNLSDLFFGGDFRTAAIILVFDDRQVIRIDARLLTCFVWSGMLPSNDLNFG